MPVFISEKDIRVALKENGFKEATLQEYSSEVVEESQEAVSPGDHEGLIVSLGDYSTIKYKFQFNKDKKYIILPLSDDGTTCIVHAWTTDNTHKKRGKRSK